MSLSKAPHRARNRLKQEGAQITAWILEANKVIAIEQTNTFGRREFDWENVPSTLIDDSASVGGRTVLNRKELEEFLDAELRGGRRRPSKLFQHSIARPDDCLARTATAVARG